MRKISLSFLFLAGAVFLAGTSMLTAQVVQRWDFESGLGDWQKGASTATITQSTWAASGTYSVKLVKEATGLEINLQNDVFKDVRTGDSISVSVFISATDLADVNGFQIFWQTGSGWSWNSVWVNASDLQGDAWTTIKRTYGTVATPLQRIGFQLLLKSGNEAKTPTLYVDDITISRAPFSIVVDANKDEFYNSLTGPSDGYLQIRSYSNSDNGRPQNDADLSAKVWTAWDQDWFYFYTEVKDDTVSGKGTSNPWEGDNLELKIDPVPNDSTQGGGSIFDMRLSAPFAETGAVVDTSLRSSIAAADKKFARRLTSDGYALEFAVKWTAIKLSSADSIHVGVDSVFGCGINVHDNDGRAGTPRQASITWAAVLLDHIWDTPKYLGTVKFLANNKLSFIPKNNMTGRTNTVPYDGSDYFKPIVIDAQKDDFYTTLTGPSNGYLQIRSYSNSDNGRPQNDADLSAKVWTAWDQDWFYYYTEVRDDTISGKGTSNPWEGDNLELKIDPVPNDSTQGGGSIFDMRLSAPFAETGAVVDTSLRSSIAAADKKFARRLMTGGYALEFAVKWTAIKLSSADSIHVGVDSVFGCGINVHDNDGRAGTPRQASITWAAVLLDHIWDTPKYLGTVKFLADNKLSFIPKNNMTGRTNTVPYDGSDYFKPIVIDAQKDDFYNTLTGPSDGYLQIRSYSNSDNGRPQNDADLSAKVWTAWDQDWFYYYTEVKDDTISGKGTSNPWEGDNLELKIDPVPNDSTQGGGSIFDMRLSAPFAETGAVVDTSLRSSIAAADKKFARRLMTGGYALEFAVKWTAIKLSSADSIHVGVDSVFGCGINVHDNDGRAGTPRQASITWAAVLLDHIWDTPKYLGTVKFLKDNKLSFIPKNNMTGRTNTVPYDGSDYFKPIVIDAQKDDFYNTLTGPSNGYLQIRSFAHSDNGAPVDDADLSAKVWTAWDQDWFYYYTEVKDDTISGKGTSNPWEGDNLELKIDPVPNDSTQGGGSIFDMRLSAPFAETGAVVDTSLRSSIAAADKKFARRLMTGGYALEFAVKWTAIKLSSADSIHVGVDSVFGCGINVHDNDGRAGTPRQASITWAAVLLDHIWDTPKYLGTVKFLKNNQLSFIPKNNMTGRTNTIPYDGTTGVNETPMVPVVFKLEQNYPNPFNPTTTIIYSIPTNSDVRLTVYDILGREVKVLVNEKKGPGVYTTSLNGGQLASGVYFYRLVAGSNIITKKMLLLK